MELDPFSGGAGGRDADQPNVADVIQRDGSPGRNLQRAAEFTVFVPEAGTHDLAIKFANGWKQERTALLEIAGFKASELKFPATEGWGSWQTKRFQVDLPAGEVLLSIVNTNESGPDIASVHLGAGGAGKGLAIGDDVIAAMGTAGIAALALALKLDDVHSKPEPVSNAAPPVSDDLPPSETLPAETQAAGGDSAPVIPADETTEETGEHYPVGSPSPVLKRADIPSDSMTFAKITTPEIPNLNIEPDFEEPDFSSAASFAAFAVDEQEEGFQTMRLEAESAVRGNNGIGSLSSTPNIITSASPGTDGQNAAPASGQSYVDFAGLNNDFNAGSGEYIQWTFEVAEAGEYDLAVGYAFSSGTAVNRPMRMDVNGQLWDRIFDLPTSNANTTYTTALTRVHLEAGTNTVRLTANGFSGANIDYLEIRAPNPNVFVFQGEDLVTNLPKALNTDQLTNRALDPTSIPNAEQFRTGAEGESYLDWAATTAGASAADKAKVAGAVADFSFDAPAAGTYQITLTFATSTTRPLDLKSVAGNGATTTLGQFAITAGAAPTRLPDDRIDLLGVGSNHSTATAIANATPSQFETWKTETLTVHLGEGQQTLRLQLAAGGVTGPNIDKIVVALFQADNSAPVAEDFAAAATEDTAVVIDVASHIDDADNDALEVSASVPAAQGAVNVSGTLITFTPAANFHGDATISYTIEDPSGLSSTAEITVTVASVNDEPEALIVTGALTLAEDSDAGTVVGAVSATDPDGDALTYSVDDPRFIVNASGQIVVVAGADFDFDAEPSILLTVTATDAGGLSTSEEVTVTVSLVNGAPEADDFAAATNEDASVVIDVLDHIDDPDGDTLTVTASVPSAQGTVSVNGTLITFTPAANFHGEASITYTVTDSSSLAANGTISVAVASENDAPTLTGTLADAAVPAEGGSVALSSLTKADVDGDATTFGVRLAGGGAAPAGIAIVGGNVTVAASVAAGNYELEIFASDGVLESAPVTFTLTKSVAPPPFSPFALQAESGVLTVLDVDANTTDTTVRDPSNPEAVGLGLPNNLRPGFTGTGYVDFGDTAGDKVTLSFTVPAGTYDVHIRYASNTARPLAFAVDGGTAVNLPFASTDPDGAGALEGFNFWQVQKTTITVGAGTHTLSLAIPAGANTGPNIDAIAFTVPGGTPSFFVPVFTSAASASFAENGAGMVLDVNATDGDGATLTYGLSGNGADDALFDINPVTGALTFKAAPDFENGSDNAYSVQVTVTDGTSTVSQTVSVSVTDVNEAPSAVTVDGALSLAEDAAAGTVVGTVSGVDPDAGDSLTFTVDDDRFVVNSNGEIVVAAGAEFDFESETSISLTITATDEGGLTKTVDVTVGVNDVNEQILPFNVTFNLAGITSYSPQDVGTGLSVADEGATLNLGGNLWKRASLGEDYTITENTKLTFTYTIGSALPEIVAIGFDDDNSPFEMADKSVYQIAGTENQPAFVDLRNGAAGAPGTTATITIDLSAHAGKTISSLVFIADDDTPGNGLGTASFTNVQLSETPVEVENAAPVIVGGGIADLVADERSSLEIDLPFVDPNGDELTYTLTVTDALGNPVPGFENLTVEDGVLVGQINAAPSAVPYIVTIVANDGNGGETSLSFDLTVENVNEAPEVDDGVAFEPYFGKVGTEIDGIDLNLFKEAFSDPDGDALTFTVEGLPAGLSLNSEGVIVGTPTGAGTGSFKIVATDPDGLRAELEIQLEIEEAGVGDVTVVQAEHFTGLASATNFYVAATAGASNNQVIRTDANEAGSVSTNLAQNGLTEGWYTVTVTVYDETDGNATFSLKIGDTQLATDKSFAEGTFDNNLPRGNAGQAGNLKTISFTTPVFIDASTIALLTGQADAGENLRIDKLTFTRVASPELPPSAVALSPAAIDENVAAGVIGTLSATDPDGEESALVYSTTDPRFTIVGNELRLADGVSLDHEAGETVTVAVKVTDAQGLSTTTNVTVTVGDVNEAPALAPTAAIADVTLTEGEAQAIDLAAALGATDPDAGDAVTYEATLAGGGALPVGITLVGSSLQIADTLAVGTYEITVFATDGDLDSESVSFTVTIEEEGVEPSRSNW